MAYNNTIVRTLYSPGYSYVRMSLYRTGMNLLFTPHVGFDNVGRSIYDRSKCQSVTIDYEQAAGLCQLATPIIEDKADWQVCHRIFCNKQAELIFEHKLEQNGQRQTYLTLEKNGLRIPHMFKTMPYFVVENGKKIEKIMRTDLGVFEKALEGYLRAIGAERHLSKLTEEELGSPGMAEPI